MKRPELSQSEMFRSMLAPDPEDNDDAYLPPEGTEESLSPEEAGITPEELKEVEELDDENDLKVRRTIWIPAFTHALLRADTHALAEPHPPRARSGHGSQEGAERQVGELCAIIRIQRFV